MKQYKSKTTWTGCQVDVQRLGNNTSLEYWQHQYFLYRRDENCAKNNWFKLCKENLEDIEKNILFYKL